MVAGHLRELVVHKRRTRGQGLVEFALVLPVILLGIFGILDLGRAVYAYSTIANSSRQASRVAIVDQNLTKIQAKAADESVALGIAPGSVSVCFLAYNSPASNPPGVCSTPAISCSSPVALGCVAEVTVPYSYSAVTPIISAIVSNISMSSTTRLPVERSFTSP